MKNADKNAAVSFGDWLFTLAVMLVPVVGLIMLFVWSFAPGTNLSKKNFSRAYLVIMLVVYAILAFAALLTYSKIIGYMHDGIWY